MSSHTFAEIEKIADASTSIELGSRLEFIIPHCDPTVNLYNGIYCLAILLLTHHQAYARVRHHRQVDQRIDAALAEQGLNGLDLGFQGGLFFFRSPALHDESFIRRICDRYSQR